MLAAAKDPAVPRPTTAIFRRDLLPGCITPHDSHSCWSISPAWVIWMCCAHNKLPQFWLHGLLSWTRTSCVGNLARPRRLIIPTATVWGKQAQSPHDSSWRTGLHARAERIDPAGRSEVSNLTHREPAPAATSS